MLIVLVPNSVGVLGAARLRLQTHNSMLFGGRGGLSGHWGWDVYWRSAASPACARWPAYTAERKETSPNTQCMPASAWRRCSKQNSHARPPHGLVMNWYFFRRCKEVFNFTHQECDARAVLYHREILVLMSLPQR